jgi:hypothetical protein
MGVKVCAVAMLLIGMGAVAGCSSTSCVDSTRCDPGTVCRAGSCITFECVAIGNCGSGEICAQIVGGKEVCTAEQCTADGTRNCPAGQVCNGGLCLAGSAEGVLPDASVVDVAVLQ